MGIIRQIYNNDYHPADETGINDREYREAVGRACCCLGEEAEEVWRVTAGIGQRIKP